MTKDNLARALEMFVMTGRDGDAADLADVIDDLITARIAEALARPAVEPTPEPYVEDPQFDVGPPPVNRTTEPSAYHQRLVERAKARPVDLDEVGQPHLKETL